MEEAKGTCACRKKVRTEQEKKAYATRINRIIGQLNGIGRMIEEDRYCGDILNQLVAADHAVRSLAAVVLEKHLKSCLVEDVQRGELGVVDEVLELFRRL